jgi:hypothetical protein
MKFDPINPAPPVTTIAFSIGDRMIVNKKAKSPAPRL